MEVSAVGLTCKGIALFFIIIIIVVLGHIKKDVFFF